MEKTVNEYAQKIGAALRAALKIVEPPDFAMLKKRTAGEILQRLEALFGTPITAERLQLERETSSGSRKRIAELALKAWSEPEKT